MGGVHVTSSWNRLHVAIVDGRLPLNETMPINQDALYYNVTAQLQGGGDVTCSITIGDQTRTGRARGGYNICSAQLNSDFGGGWS